ncbi:MAG: hypothetical protein ABI895_27410 [Deltaproteobacteria bacterium]
MLGLAALFQPELASGQLPAPASASPAPASIVSEPSVQALLFDLERIIAAQESSGWLLDDVAQNEIYPDVMESLCRATPDVRRAAEQRLGQRSAAAGDPRALYERAGAQLGADVTLALTTQRTLAALTHGLAVADQQCPFWVRPEPEFRGLQSTRDRWIVNFDTGGTAQLRRTQREWSVGAGGFGRVLAGYSFTRVSLLAGIEMGGGALVVPNTQPTAFVVNYIPAVPVLLRWHLDAWNLDLEAASVGLFQAGNTRLSYGLRGGITIGVSGLRMRGILPWVGIGVASEYHFETSARPEAWYLRSGLRVGGVWDP